MRWREILFSVAAPLISWLLLGAPRLNLMGNLALFAVLSAHLYVVIWNDLAFRFFRSDRFTYGAVAMTLNLISVATNFVAVWFTLHNAAKHIERIPDISPYSWGVIALCLLATMIHKSATASSMETAKASEEKSDERQD